MRSGAQDDHGRACVWGEDFPPQETVRPVRGRVPHGYAPARQGTFPRRREIKQKNFSIRDELFI